MKDTTYIAMFAGAPIAASTDRRTAERYLEEHLHEQWRRQGTYPLEVRWSGGRLLTRIPYSSEVPQWTLRSVVAVTVLDPEARAPQPDRPAVTEPHASTQDTETAALLDAAMRPAKDTDQEETR